MFVLDTVSQEWRRRLTVHIWLENAVLLYSPPPCPSANRQYLRKFLRTATVVGLLGGSTVRTVVPVAT